MTTPDFNVIDVIPLKYKPIVGLIGSALTFVVPSILEYSTSLPQPWPWVIAAVIALLTTLGIYRAPYKPEGTVLVPAQVAAAGTKAVQSAPPVAGEFRNPWQ